MIGTVMLILAIAVAGKMILVQTKQADVYRDFAHVNNFRLATVKGERGNLYASNGVLLATTVTKHHIYMDLATISDTLFNKNVYALSDSLSIMFDKPISYFEKKLRRERQAKNRYMLLVKGLDYDQYQRIKEFPIFNKGQNKGGFIHETESKRVLAIDDIGRRTIGHDTDKRKSGLEGAYSSYLKGKEGRRLERFMGRGKWRPIDQWQSVPLDGADVYTTIDVGLQNTVYNALNQQLTEYQAVRGCAIVMEVATGKVRAMVNLSRNQDGTYADVQNHAIWESAEPGSTIKTMVLLAGLEHEKFDTATVVETGRGYYRINGRTIRDSHAGGTMNVKKVLQESSNVGVVKLTQQHYAKNPDELFNQFKTWKLNKRIGIDIPGEGKPEIPDPNGNKWSAQSLASFSFGYETKLTPLQILTFYNGIANNGKMLKPLFVDKIVRKGKLEKKFQPQIMVQQMAKPKNIAKIQKMLVNVVENGTARNIKSSNYKMAGKTGTAKVEYWVSNQQQQYMASFAGYFPAKKPKYSCYVMVYKPSRDKGFYGSQVAAPVFKIIADKVYSSSPKKINPASKTEYLTIQNQIQQPNNLALKSTQKTIPNLVGKNGYEAVAELENLGLIVKYTGVGKVVQQSIKPGQSIKKGNIIYLKLNN